jgi:hypothetical protein
VSLSERAEIEGFADLCAAVPEHVAAELGIAGGTVGGAVCVAARAMPGSRMFNHVMGLGFDLPATGEDLPRRSPRGNRVPPADGADLRAAPPG